MEGKAKQENVIIINSLCKSYGKVKAVKDLSFSVKRGEIFGFLGPNGAGKTTTIRVLMGQIFQDEGNFQILGINNGVRSDTKLMDEIGYISGEGYIYENWSARRLFEYLSSISHKQIEFNSFADRLDLDLDRKISELSSGNKQKVLLVQAFMKMPKLLILDEPTSGLDPLLQNIFEEMLFEFRENGGTVLLSSHILSEVQRVCDRVGIIRQGELIKVSTIGELIPKTYFLKLWVEDDLPSDLMKLLPDMKAEGQGRYHAKYLGDINQLINLLAKLKIKHLTISEPKLEEMFLELYNEK